MPTRAWKEMTGGIYFCLSLTSCHAGKDWFVGGTLSDTPETPQATEGPVYYKKDQFPQKFPLLSYKG